MDNQSKTVTKRKTEGKLGKILAKISRGFSGERENLLFDLIMFSLGFLLSRCHLIFGAHPMGLAFLCALPISLWSTLLGAVIGSFTMGISGIIFAVVSAIAVFLRVAISSSGKECEGVDSLFRESLPLRISVGIICGFVAALYEVLISDFSQGSLLFGIAMIISTPMLVFIFSGLFSTNIDIRNIFSAEMSGVFEGEKSVKEKYNLAF